MNNNIILNRVFTQNNLKQLAYYKIHNTILGLDHYIDGIHKKTYNQVFSECYLYLQKNYRNEYFYKNTLLNKLLLGVHKPSTTVALSEIAIGKSKADFVLINGKAVVYEIKTELDNFDRLETQINDYYKAFNHVCVLTSWKNINAIKEKLANTPVGIYILNKKNQISRIKEPEISAKKLEKEEMFKVLNKNEYERIIEKYYGYLPNVSQVDYYSHCLELFCKIDMGKCYDLYLRELKYRNMPLIEEFNKVPYELKSIVYFSKYNKNDYNKLFKILNEKVGG